MSLSGNVHRGFLCDGVELSLVGDVDGERTRLSVFCLLNQITTMLDVQNIQIYKVIEHFERLHEGNENRG